MADFPGEFLIILGGHPETWTKPFRREVVDSGLFGPIRSLKAGERARYLRKMPPKSTENPWILGERMKVVQTFGNKTRVSPFFPRPC